MRGGAAGQQHRQTSKPPPHIPIKAPPHGAQPQRPEERAPLPVCEDSNKQGIEAALNEYQTFKRAGMLEAWRFRWQHVLKNG